MQVHILKSKIHRVKVTDADLNYIGSTTIDEDLMDAANLLKPLRHFLILWKNIYFVNNF